MQYYMSIAYAVDLTYWQQKGQNMIPLFYTSSFGEAYQWIEQQEQQKMDPFEQDVKPFYKDQWNQLRLEAEKCFEMLQGRALLWSEVLSLIRKRNIKITEETLRAVLQLLYLEEKVKWYPGVSCSKWLQDWVCHRCQADFHHIRLTRCASCGKHCAMCEHCIMLSRSRTCTPFFLFSAKKVEQQCPVEVKSLRLTAGQARVSEQILDFLQGEEMMFLLWAVTGAGKTEMMVPAIRHLLSEGKRVCWTTPRTDVVHELVPRLRALFPKENVLALYGGSSDLWMDGSIVIATAHQALRYVQVFDLIIVDEVDAFPLYQNRSLEQGIHRALSQSGKIVLLTATPPKEWLAWSRSGRLPSAILPVRFHGYPLPVPRLFQERRLWEKVKRQHPIPVLSRFIEQVIRKDGQAMIFVPGIWQVKQLVSWLHKHVREWHSICGVYSQTPERAEIIDQFRRKELQCLVTTTILERGVTVPHCHVLVMGADHPVFDQAALIQMAGRVGRSKDYQQGEVWFLSMEKTESQIQAKKQMDYLNSLAEKEGFIKQGAYYQ
ncbi:competence protein ComFA [Thermoflavimicrobium dichotomicum]|uniref:Competence protein ComFA n=2 Tax=Thermoflavimicrobium dichotomicum TaxID=46223 RepID=A0A1I3JXX8_9BACL|nr:competence protein ComFA [Thermoflavimicrobium dichotomicum]